MVTDFGRDPGGELNGEGRGREAEEAQDGSSVHGFSVGKGLRSARYIPEGCLERRNEQNGFLNR